MLTSVISLILLIIIAIINVFLLLKKQGNHNDALESKLTKLDTDISRLDSLLRDEFGRNRAEMQNALKENREEQSKSFQMFSEAQTKNITELYNAQKNLLESYHNRLKEIQEAIEKKLALIQEDNNKKLDEMRKTVDEKLQESVEKRFNESFKLINERLEAVHKGLGEMQNLAAGVGDLKKVLTNVKTRGTFGEVQLGAILEQFLSPEQYTKNDHPDQENDRRVVEFSIKLPGNEKDEPVLLPVDSKFPIEDYQRLLDAYENNPEQVEAYSNQLGKSLEKCAKDIFEKYIKPPKTTDFAILFVPTEGLYAEILRRAGLIETIQNKFRVTVVGPTNLVAFLTSLQMGFRTLAIQKSSSAVWETLGAVKTEFGKFGVILDRTKKRLALSIDEIEKAGTRSKVIERKLKSVEALPEDKTLYVLGETIDIEEEIITEAPIEDEILQN